jgi:type VI secretion system secreted protein VgrG
MTGSRVGTAKVTIPGAEFDLVSFRGEEYLSGLFHFSLELKSDEQKPDFQGIVGKAATVEIDLTAGGTRCINGIVGRFIQGGHDDRQATYFAELYPWLWLLTHGADCRIFQEKTVPDIIKQVFGDVGQTDFKNELQSSYSPREYCVQYNETHFDFVSRLMEEEGIYYFFRHSSDKHEMVFGDANSVFQPCEGADTIRCSALSEIEFENVMITCSIEESVVPGLYAHDDFNFETPSTNLEAKAAGTKGAQPDRRRIYQYPGGFPDTGVGGKLSDVRIQELETPQKILRGRCFAPGLTAGGTFTLENHYRDDLNIAYLVTRVTHEASDEVYVSSFEATPKTVDFRPRRFTPQPKIAGTQTAIVVGKAGEEIWTDKYGRVKVQFHWDQEGKKDDKSSCWVRVAQGWAGKSWGQIYIPRIGQEVIVSFEEGDPDRPLITGRVYNAEQTVPYTLPDNATQSGLKTRSSKDGDGETFNELRFEDKKDEEQIYFHAEKDFNRIVENNDTLKVGYDKKDKGDQTIEIFNNRTVTIEEGKDKLHIKKGNRDTILDKGNEKLQLKEGKREIVLDKGDQITQIAEGNRTVKIDTGTDTLKIKGDRKVTISTGNHALKVDAGQSSTQAMKAIELKVGGNSIKIDMKGITIKGMMVKVQGDIKVDVASPMTSVKGDAMTKVESGGVLLIKGAIMKFG